MNTAFWLNVGVMLTAGALVVLTLPAAVLLAQLLAALTVRRLSLQGDAGPAPADGLPAALNVVVLIPAHNEAACIGRTLASLQAGHGPLRVLVVADNCTDDTAAVARLCGADVVERRDPVRRGKGHALQFGVDRLRDAPPEVVVVVDADCQTTPDGVLRLARLCRDRAQPIQGINLMHAPPGAGLGVRVAEFTWMIKTCIRPLGWQRWGAPCPLMGTGFALPWSLAQGLPLASGHIVEDLQLTLYLARKGIKPLWAPVCRVDSLFPSTTAAQTAQRSRWEHGHLQLVLGEVPRALAESLLPGRRAMLPVALDLCVPPLSFLVLTLAGVAGVAGLLALAGGPAWLWGWGSGLVALMALAVLAVWWRWARQLLSPRELLGIPWFVLKKIGLYRRFFGARHTEWNRADRE